jgi:hypothetical protein
MDGRYHTISTRSKFCCHTFASSKQVAISAAILCILQTSSQFCCHTFASLEQAAIFATNLFKQAASSAAHISSNKLPALPLCLCIFVPEATLAIVAQVVTIDYFCKFMTNLFALLTICNFHYK